MLILVNGASTTVAAHRHSKHLGILISPRSGNSMAAIQETGLPWAADNDAFGAWSEARFRRMLSRIEGQPGLLWVVAPDVVGNARETLARYRQWESTLCEMELPIAYVSQDGAERHEIPETARCLFVGGTDRFKLSRASMDIAHEAKRRGLWIHVGRVNSFSRAWRARFDFEADSIDGGQFSRFARTRIPPALEHLRQAPLL